MSSSDRHLSAAFRANHSARAKARLASKILRYFQISNQDSEKCEECRDGEERSERGNGFWSVSRNKITSFVHSFVWIFFATTWNERERKKSKQKLPRLRSPVQSRATTIYRLSFAYRIYNYLRGSAVCFQLFSRCRLLKLQSDRKTELEDLSAFVRSINEEFSCKRFLDWCVDVLNVQALLIFCTMILKKTLLLTKWRWSSTGEKWILWKSLTVVSKSFSKFSQRKSYVVEAIFRCSNLWLLIFIFDRNAQIQTHILICYIPQYSLLSSSFRYLL